MARHQYRLRFVYDEDARFEECNGEARPLTPEEYAENSYRACPDHPRAGSTVIRRPKGKPPVVGCAVCKRTDYQDIPYEEYRAYYGNPQRHVYLQLEVQRRCECCGHWAYVSGLGWIDLMDDSPEYRAVVIGHWYTPTDVRKLPGYLREVATDGLKEARETKG